MSEEKNQEDEPLLQEIGTAPGQLYPGLIRTTIYDLIKKRPDLAPLLQAVVNGLDRFFQLTYLFKKLGLVANPHNAIPHRTTPDLIAKKLSDKPKTLKNSKNSSIEKNK